MKSPQLQRYAIAGPQNFKNMNRDDALQSMNNIIASGITMFQYRDKGTIWLNQVDRQEYVQALRNTALKYEVPFIINDDVALAVLVHADGVHVGQKDESIDIVKQQLSDDMILGLSINNLAEMQQVSDNRIDYLGLGPIYPTQSKSDASEAIGIDAISEYLGVNKLGLPIVGIGGITLDNMSELKKAGLDGVSVISLLTESKHPEQMVQEMKEVWEKA